MLKAFARYAFAVLLTMVFSTGCAHAALPLEKIKLPKDFKITVFAADLPGARALTMGEKGTIFVGTRGQGKVYAIAKNGKVHTIAKGLHEPNGVAFLNGSLYVAEINRILRFDKIEAKLESPPAFQVVTTDLPSKLHHGWKFIAFGPDKKLYVPVGAPCNVCAVDDPYAAILRMNADGGAREVFARGVRNTVGFDWHPVTKELWFTDNGRDMLGDSMPPDELNRAPRSGMHFGFPFCHGGSIADPSLGGGRKCSEFTPPVQKLEPHVAALGMRFYTGQQFPAEYRQQIFIAEHGSWNRSTPLGYRVMLVKLDDNGRSRGTSVFAEGWLQDGKAWGRPVDVLVDGDGSLLVSDDKAGVVYRISYK